jgi:hypothetical protein
MIKGWFAPEPAPYRYKMDEHREAEASKEWPYDEETQANIAKAFQDSMQGSADVGNDYTHSLHEVQEPRYDTEFSGELFDHTLPHARDLDNGLLRDRVFDFMSDGCWRTLAEISYACNGSEASCSARLRDFRKSAYGSHVVDRKHVGSRLYVYSLHINHDRFEVPF